MNSFTDASPSFPYQSSFARSQIGIPDSPLIHFAITELAEQALQYTEGSHYDKHHKRIVAIRAASGAVLFSKSLFELEVDVRSTCGRDIEEGTAERYEKEPRVNWLAKAAAKLREQGIPVAANFQQQRTAYGWREVD